MFHGVDHSSGLTKCRNEDDLKKNFRIFESGCLGDLSKTKSYGSFLRKKRKIHNYNEYTSNKFIKKSFMNIDISQSVVVLLISLLALIVAQTDCISVKPIDFDRYILPCYTGVWTTSANVNVNNQAQYNAQPPLSYSGGLSNSLNVQQQQQQPQNQYGQQSSSFGGGGGYQQQQQQQRINPGQFGSATFIAGNQYGSSGLTDLNGGLVLGQRIPHGQTIENFIDLVSKIESNNPRLASNLDQFIRVLLSRFHYDNYYYDVKTRAMSSSNDKDIRSDIVEQLLNPLGQQQVVVDTISEEALTEDEKCSMYFMLSHHIEKDILPLGVNIKGPTRPLSDIPAYGLLPAVRNSAGVGYPAQQASASINGGPKLPGVNPGFGQNAANGPAYSTINQPGYNGQNPLGMNSQFSSSNPNQLNSNFARPNSGGSVQGGLFGSSQSQQAAINQAMLMNQQNRQKIAYEYGVISVGNQDNSNVVISRVLLAILAASQPPQQIRQLAASVYPNFDLSSTTKKLDEEIDPLFAVTLADLWAISSHNKKPLAPVILGDEGHWNSTTCPTSLRLERSDSIKFTTAELNGGLDGLNLGRAIRDIMSLRRSMKLSDLLRTYYSKYGFRPQLPEVGVCQRVSALNTRQEELKQQAENYLRLYDLKSPESDNALVSLVMQLDSFRDFARRAAITNTPRSICEDPGDIISNTQDQCEIAKADVVAIMDVSPQANEPFMEQCIYKLSHRINMWKHGSTMTILTNQVASTAYGGSYNFNSIVRNSSNPALIGCVLDYDGSRIFQGGQMNDPLRLVEMFEQTFVVMDHDKNIQRQQIGSSSSFSSYLPTPFSSNVPSINGQGLNKNTGASKSIIWFNYGSISRPQTYSGNSYNQDGSTSSYRFQEAKRMLYENYRGAVILAIGPNNEDLMPFVFEQRDAFSDVPALSTRETYAEYISSGQSFDGVSGPAEHITQQLAKRICEAPATFEHPNCYRSMSDNTVSTGYITPGRKQYWMMYPRTFFASDSARMVFKVEGGRIRVCFGREPRPDETAINSGLPVGPNTLSSQTTSSTNNYYTGKDYGICKDAGPGQDIQFIVDDPCYKESIATCKPFYYVIKELSQGGESDPNWVCKDEGCKRFDQVKFRLIHSGISCSSAFKTVVSNPFLIFGSIIYTMWLYYRNTGASLTTLA